MIVNNEDYPGGGLTGGPYTDEPARLPAALSRYTGYLLHAAFVRARRIAGGAIDTDMDPRQYVILQAIDELAASQGELGASLDINRNAMVAIVDALEEKGLVERRRDPADRRAYRLVVTDRGAEALATARPVMARCDAELTRRLSAAERGRLNELLRTLLAGLGDAGHPLSLADRSGFLIARSHLRLRTMFERALEPLGIQARHFGALAVCGVKPGSQQSLAHELGVSGTLVVELVDTLEQGGLVERRRNPADRRSYVIETTDAGAAALGRAREAVAELEGRIAEIVGEGGRDELVALLRRLLGVADAPPDS